MHWAEIAALAVGAAAALIAGAFLLRIGLSLLMARRDAYSVATAHAPPDLGTSLSGNSDPYRHRKRDYAISAGLAVDKTGKLIPQARLSDEIVERLI